MDSEAKKSTKSYANCITTKVTKLQSNKSALHLAQVSYNKATPCSRLNEFAPLDIVIELPMSLTIQLSTCRSAKPEKMTRLLRCRERLAEWTHGCGAAPPQAHLDPESQGQLFRGGFQEETPGDYHYAVAGRWLRHGMPYDSSVSLYFCFNYHFASNFLFWAPICRS